MLEVLGAGLGRTGTLSLKQALEFLGFGPAYHMFEVYEHPEHADVWLRAARGEAVDWDDVLGNYRSSVDWPGCTFWRELLAWAPRAKVVLTVRSLDDWYASFNATVYRVLTQPRPRLARFADEVVGRRTFGQYLDLEQSAAIGAYQAHYRAVAEGVPAEQLLVYDVGEGWAPLCRFLGCPVPAAPFPAVNDRGGFMRRHAYLTGEH